MENVPPMDWEKYLEEIELDVMEEPHKVSKFHSTQKEEDSTMMWVYRAAPVGSSSVGPRNNDILGRLSLLRGTYSMPTEECNRVIVW